MKMGVLGSGVVGQSISVRLAELGHDAMIGTRDTNKLTDWQKTEGAQVKIGSFAEAATHGEMIFNATNGAGSLNALKTAGESSLGGKVLVDISNPLDFSRGFPPSLLVSSTDSLGEQIQRTYPSAKVVKTLNTVTAQLMVYPRNVADGDHQLFVCGNDVDAKAQVVELLKSFGWIHIMDQGDISNARGVESYLLLWIRIYGALNNGMFNIKIMK
jgi:8-hydroxy-5-deazaflavin:NADPH oxidoreductase